VDEVRIVFGKWGGRPHWEFDALRLGEDEHGVWLGTPRHTPMRRPGAEFRTGEHQVVLVPPDAYVATFYAPGGTVPCDIYVDISTVPVVGDGSITTVDLDLDVIRGWTGRVWVDDEDEFADHRVRFGYPSDVVDLAVISCEAVRRAVAASRAPFDGPTAQRWFDVLEGAMMA
jgi:predicted RNA-binding protein associated with RNAse of E/G family